MSQHESIKIKGHDFLRQCHFPMYWLARMREMKVNDIFIMGSIRHHYGDNGLDYEGVVEIHCRKGKRGVYSLYSTWSLLTNKPQRPLMFTNMNFKIETGGYLSFFENFDTDFKTFKRTARLLNRLIYIADKEMYLKLGLPAYLYGVHIDKNNLTVRSYYSREKALKRKFRFSDDQLPKPMMECICDYGIASSLINFDKARNDI